MMIASVTLALALLVAAARAQSTTLELGYATEVRPTPGAPCELRVNVPIGTRALRFFADKRRFLGVGRTSATRLYAGRVVPGQAPTASGGAAEAGDEAGDVLLAVDTKGVPGDWWLLVESDGDQPIEVTAVAYDVTRQPRVQAKLGRQTGVVAVEYGKAEVYQLPPMDQTKKHTVTVDIDAGWIGTIGDEYDVYVNILDDAKARALLADVPLFLVDQLFKRLVGNDLSVLRELAPALLAPTADSHDLHLKGHLFNLGSVQFDVPASASIVPHVYVAVAPRGAVAGLSLPWTQRIASFTVGFAANGGSINGDPNEGTCQAPGAGRRRAVAQDAADPCVNKPCQECFEDANCQFCYGPTAGSGTASMCRSTGSACPADSPAVSAVATCTECDGASGEDACNALPGDNCVFCSLSSAGALNQQCTTSWFCEASEGVTSDELADVTPAITESGNPGTPTTMQATGPSPISAASSVVASIALVAATLSLASLA